jgi:hypothetical protein
MTGDIKTGNMKIAGRIPRALIAAILILALIRAVIAGTTGLVDDEAYYRLWSLHPALSYLDHPPMVAYMIAAGRAIFGDNPFGIRFGAGIAALVTLAATWRTVALLFSTSLAGRTLWLMLGMPLLAVGGIIITPDIPSVMFLALALWTLAELHRSGNANWWLATGLFCGLGLLSKYTNLFAGATILIWLLWVPDNRKWFKSWQLWAGGALAAALTLPVVLWNAEHDWASFTKQFGRVGKGNDIGIAYIGEMLGGLAALANPVIFILAVTGFAALARKAWTARDSAATLVIAAILPMAAYFLIHALHDRVQGNWLGPLYPALAVCAAVALAAMTDAVKQSRTFIAALATGAAMIGFIYLHTLMPLTSGLLRADPTSQMRGWPEFAEKVDRLRLEQGAQWIATSSFATTAQLAYALKDKPVPVLQLNERLRYLHLPAPDPALLQSPALYVDLARRERSDLLSALFQSVTPLAAVHRGPDVSPFAIYATRRLAAPRGHPLADTATVSER